MYLCTLYMLSKYILSMYIIYIQFRKNFIKKKYIYIYMHNNKLLVKII